MRKLLYLAAAGAVAVLVGATAATATPPEHYKLVFAPEFTFPAGTLCDFDYHQSAVIDVNFHVFDDGATLEQGNGTVTHTNVGSGYTLTERVSYSNRIDAAGATQVTRGLFWHLRDADGTIVQVHAGRIVFDLDPFEVVSYTPNSGPDFAAVICPALGGAPA